MSVWSVCVLGVLCAVSWTQGSGVPCPYETCQCDFTFVDCTLQNLTSLPVLKSGTFTQTKLVLSGNNICDIQDAQRWVHGLDYLDMNHNCLTEMPDFTRLTTLQTLKLYNNQIVDPASLRLPISLHRLNLNYNRLTRVPHDISSLTNLYHLKFEFNKIHSLDNVTFPSSLYTLYLKNNNLQNITSINFVLGTSNLIYLYLNNNPIKHISPDAFNQIPKLTQLFLQSTKLTRLPLALHFLTHLHLLDLSNIPNMVCTCQQASLVPWFNNLTLTIENGSYCDTTTVIYFLRVLAPNCPQT